MTSRAKPWRAAGVALGLVAALFLPPAGIVIGAVLLVLAGRSPRSAWLVAAALGIVALSVTLLLFGTPGPVTGGLIDPA